MELQPRSIPAPKDWTGKSTLMHMIAALLVEDVSELCVRMAIINRGDLDQWTRHATNGVKSER